MVITRAAVLREPHGPFMIEDLNLQEPRPDEVLVRLVATGLCHTDLAVREGIIPSPLPIVLGHEGAGVVEATGSSVRGIERGDHVVLSYLSCGACPECFEGRPASCANLGRLCFGGGRADGSHALHSAGCGTVNDRFFGQSSFAHYSIAHERNTIVVRKDAPLDLLGPLGCGILTGAGAIWNELNVGPGASLAVFGAGAVGLSAVMAARVAGARTIIAVDRVLSRLELARELGATHIVDASKDDPLEAIRRIGGEGTQFGLDTTGRLAVIRTMVKALRQRGQAAIVAVTEPRDIGVDGLDLLTGCKSIRGIIEGGGSAHILIPRMIDLYLDGRFPFDRLVQFFDFDQINAAVEAAQRVDVVKPVLRMPAQTVEGGDKPGQWNASDLLSVAV